jgi:hypothetical protein
VVPWEWNFGDGETATGVTKRRPLWESGTEKEMI